MPVKITALKETRPNENRVALVPSVAKRLQKLGIELNLAAGAGEAARQRLPAPVSEPRREDGNRHPPGCGRKHTRGDARGDGSAAFAPGVSPGVSEPAFL